MKFPPFQYSPGPLRIYNGRATFAQDALEVDQYTTWLAAVRKHAIPVGLSPLKSTSGALDRAVPIPMFTQYLGFGFFVTGQGSITVTTPGDANNSVTVCEADDGTGTPNVHHPSRGRWVWTTDAVVAGGDGQQRALEMGAKFTGAEDWVTLHVVVTNKAADRTLAVHQLVVIPFVAKGEELP